MREKKPKQITKDSSFVARIRRGNRQWREIVVRQSKKFSDGKDTYFVIPSCIFNRASEGRLRGEAYYTEGNPMPHDFRHVNVGIERGNFNEKYGEDLYEILIELQKDPKAMYLLYLYVLVFIMSVINLIGAFVG